METHQGLGHVDGRVVDLERLEELHRAVGAPGPEDAQLGEALGKEGELGADGGELNFLRDLVPVWLLEGDGRG